MTDESKTCTRCGRQLPNTTEYFHRNKVGRIGVDADTGESARLLGACKVCVLEKAKSYRERNREVVNKKSRAYYWRNRDEILRKAKDYVLPQSTIEKSRIRNKENYAKSKQWLMQYKAERGCCVCGEKDPVVLALHHTDPSTKHPLLKKNGGGILALGVTSLSRAKDEAEKCVVMCMNCHTKLHFG